MTPSRIRKHQLSTLVTHPLECARYNSCTYGTGTGVENSKTARPTIDKLYMENTLLRVAGGLFCHDQKRASKHTAQIEFNRGAQEKLIVIRPDPQLGQPGPLAHRIFVALIKKHSDYGRPIQSEVSFTKRELMRLAGRKKWGGAHSEQLLRAITQIQTTLVCANFRNGEGRYIEERFNIFSKTRIERREFASDPIEACTITLAEPIVRSLQNEHFTCLNDALMQQLGTIGQALYIRLFFHFANRFDGRASDLNSPNGTTISAPNGLVGSSSSNTVPKFETGSAASRSIDSTWVSCILRHHRCKDTSGISPHVPAGAIVLPRL